MTLSSEVYIVLGALLGIAAACITPGLIFSMSEDTSDENETKKKDNKNEQIIMVHDPNNGENENPSGTSQNNAITVTNKPNNNAVNTKRSTSNKNKLTMVVHDQNNNKIDEKIYGESTIQSVLNVLEEELPKLLPTINVHINVNGENTEEPSNYEDALSHITNHDNPTIQILVHSPPKLNNENNDDDDDTEYIKLPKETAVGSKKDKFEENLGSFRNKMPLTNNSNRQDNNNRLFRQSTVLDSKRKKIKKKIPLHEETIEYYDNLANNCDCENCKPPTENSIRVVHDSKNYIQNISNHPISTKTTDIKYPVNITATSDTFEEISLLAADDKSSEKIEIGNGSKVILLPSKKQKLIRKIRNFFVFKKSLHQKTSFSPGKVKYNGCKAYKSF